MSASENAESPRKRIKLSSESKMLTEAEVPEAPAAAALPVMPSPGKAAHASKEAEVGITDYVSTVTPGFGGVLKKRYTDFLVNEILPNGRVVHLQKLGSAAASQSDGKTKLVISSEQTDTGVLSSDTPGTSSVISTPVAIAEASKSDERMPEKAPNQSLDERGPQVRLPVPKTRILLT
jgi:tRNA pseudouridine13 synthase